MKAVKNMGSGMVERHGDRPGRDQDQPAFTIRASAGGTEPGGFVWEDDTGTRRKLTTEEAAALQSYPVVFRNGNQANASRRSLDQPAPTLMFGARSNKVEWMDPALAGDPAASGERVTIEQASALQTYPTGDQPEQRNQTMDDIVALDLFAGTGWGVACKRLGIEERGVELMDAAVETRTANGMETVYRDVWDGILLSREMHELLYGVYTLLIGSPPCQTFSMAGNGAGRKALNEVIEAIRLHAYKDPAELLAFGEKHDMRTALVLTPLAYVYRDRPRYVALEQVPTVLPVWEECAKVMREWGYSVQTAVLSAEQYGVPQTRKRAILVARLDGPVALPAPTHSRYYPRTPDKLDPGVEKWVSMAEALGWGMTARPYLTVTGGGDKDSPLNKHVGDPAPSALGSRASRERVATEREAGRWVWPDAPDRQLMTPGGELKMLPEELALIQSYPPYVTYTQNNRQAHQSRRTLDQPAPTVTAGHDSTNRGFFDQDGEFTMATPEQVAALQSYPVGRGLTDRPSPTITGGGTETGGAEPIAKYHERYTSAPGWVGSTDRLEPEEAAALQTYPAPLRTEVEDWKWVDAPSTTVGGCGRITAREHHYHGEQGRTALRLDQREAGTMQTFPPEPAFTWCGSRSKVFLQIGNAVPPLLAQRILEALVQDNDLL